MHDSYCPTRMTAIVPQAVLTENRLGINSCHAISRLYQAGADLGIFQGTSKPETL